MSTSTLRLPPRTAKNYHAQVIHRFYSIVAAIEQPLDNWVQEVNWAVEIANSEAEERGEKFQPVEAVALKAIAIPDQVKEFREMFASLSLDSTAETQLAVLDKIIDRPFRVTSSFDRTLVVTQSGNILLSVLTRSTETHDQFQVKMKTAQALARIAAAVGHFFITNRFFMAIGVVPFWEQLPRLVIHNVYPLCTETSTQTECIAILAKAIQGLAVVRPRDRSSVASIFLAFKRVMENPASPPQTTNAVYEALAEVIGLAQFDPPWFRFLADSFHQVRLHVPVINAVRNDFELCTPSEDGSRGDLILKMILDDDDNEDVLDEDTSKELNKGNLISRRKAFIEAGGASLTRKRFVRMIDENVYDANLVIIIQACGETDWASVFELDDVERFATALYQDEAKFELLRTFRAFLSHPEALKRCQNMRFYRPVMNDLHEDHTFTPAAMTLIRLLVGYERPDDQDEEWLTILVRVICANIGGAFEDNNARIAVISLLMIIITIDRAQVETMRQLKLEPLLFFWSHDPDQPEDINAMAAALGLMLRGNDLEVDVELVENGLSYLDQFEQKSLSLPGTQDESADDPGVDATDKKEPRCERPIKETTLDIVGAMQKRGLLQCNTFGFQSQARDDPDSSLPDLFREYFEYCHEKSEQVYAAGVPLVATFVSANNANPHELKALEPGICNVVIEDSMDEIAIPPKIRWTKAEKKGHYHQHTTLTDPKRAEKSDEFPPNSGLEDDDSRADTTDTPSTDGDDDDEDDANDNDDVVQEDDNGSYVVPSDSDESVGDLNGLDEFGEGDLEQPEQTDDEHEQETSDEARVSLDGEFDVTQGGEQTEVSAIQDTTEEPKDRSCHENTSCDGCGAEPSKGTRYKCKQCADYDLCTDCHDTAPYIHPEHTWHPVELYGDYDEEQGIAWYLTDEDKEVKLGAHLGIECVQCKRSPIYNTRSQCGACDANYCSACINDRKVTCKENGGQCFYFRTTEPPEQGEETEGRDQVEPEGDDESDPAAIDSDTEAEEVDDDEEGDEEEYHYPDEIVALAKAVTTMLWALRYKSSGEEDGK